MSEWMNEWMNDFCNSIIMNLLLSKHLMCFCDMMQLQCPVGSSHRRYWHVKAMAWDHLWPALSRDLKGSAWRCNFLGGSASDKLARWLLLLVADDMNFNDLQQHRIVGYHWITHRWLLFCFINTVANVMPNGWHDQFTNVHHWRSAFRFMCWLQSTEAHVFWILESWEVPGFSMWFSSRH